MSEFRANQIPNPPATVPPARYMQRLVDSLRMAVRFSLSAETANNSVLLRSPAGKVYEVTVDDAGALVVTYVQG